MLCPSHLCLFFCVSYVPRPNVLATYWAKCKAYPERETTELEFPKKKLCQNGAFFTWGIEATMFLSSRCVDWRRPRWDHGQLTAAIQYRAAAAAAANDFKGLHVYCMLRPALHCCMMSIHMSTRVDGAGGRAARMEILLFLLLRLNQTELRWKWDSVSFSLCRMKTRRRHNMWKAKRSDCLWWKICMS
jgi:hypothetical protein